MIGALMRLPWEAVTYRLLRALREHGFSDIDGPQLSVILWPGPDGLRPSDLAARMRVTKQALNYLLRGLEQNGYLKRQPDPDDRRARRIALTDHGRALVTVIRGAVAEAEREWTAAPRRGALRAAPRASDRAERRGRARRAVNGDVQLAALAGVLELFERATRSSRGCSGAGPSTSMSDG